MAGQHPGARKCDRARCGAREESQHPARQPSRSHRQAGGQGPCGCRVAARVRLRHGRTRQGPRAGVHRPGPPARRRGASEGCRTAGNDLPVVPLLRQEVQPYMRLSLAEQKAGGTRQSTLVLASLCVLAGLAAYANGLSGPLVMDDQASVLFNPQMRHLWPLVDALAPPRNSALYGRPLVNLSFAVNYALGGLSVPGYHLVNVGLHILSALLLFGIVRLTLARPELRDRFAATADTIALACAVIWLVHPIQTESVDYLTQRTELMMGFFYLLAMYAAIRALQSATPNGWHVAAIVSCLLGAGCKESIVTVPLLVVLYDRIFVFDSMKEALRARKTLYLGLALSWIELAALVGSRNSTAGFGAGTSVWTYLLNQAQMVSRYLALTIWP